MMDAVQAEGHDVRAPVGRGVAAALAADYLPAVERDGGALRLLVAARGHGCRQVETYKIKWLVL